MKPLAHPPVHPSRQPSFQGGRPREGLFAQLDQRRASRAASRSERTVRPPPARPVPAALRPERQLRVFSPPGRCLPAPLESVLIDSSAVRLSSENLNWSGGVFPQAGQVFRFLQSLALDIATRGLHWTDVTRAEDHWWPGGIGGLPREPQLDEAVRCGSLIAYFVAWRTLNGDVSYVAPTGAVLGSTAAIDAWMDQHCPVCHGHLTLDQLLEDTGLGG